MLSYFIYGLSALLPISISYLPLAVEKQDINSEFTSEDFIAFVLSQVVILLLLAII